tara:strand:+ start:299 stop:631 length:333 start_codon:yes stop_codon:yes gene_type:complete
MVVDGKNIIELLGHIQTVLADAIVATLEPRAKALAIFFQALAPLAPAAIHRPRLAIVALPRARLDRKPHARKCPRRVHASHAHPLHAGLLVRAVVVAVLVLCQENPLVKT